MITMDEILKQLCYYLQDHDTMSREGESGEMERLESWLEDHLHGKQAQRFEQYVNESFYYYDSIVRDAFETGMRFSMKLLQRMFSD